MLRIQMVIVVFLGASILWGCRPVQGTSTLGEDTSFVGENVVVESKIGGATPIGEYAEQSAKKIQQQLFGNSKPWNSRFFNITAKPRSPGGLYYGQAKNLNESIAIDLLTSPGDISGAGSGISDSLKQTIDHEMTHGVIANNMRIRPPYFCEEAMCYETENPSAPLQPYRGLDSNIVKSLFTIDRPTQKSEPNSPENQLFYDQQRASQALGRFLVQGNFPKMNGIPEDGRQRYMDFMRDYVGDSQNYEESFNKKLGPSLQKYYGFQDTHQFTDQFMQFMNSQNSLGSNQHP